MNILSLTFNDGGFMLCLIPVIIAIIMTKRYNMIHGFITYFFLSAIFYSIALKSGNSLNAIISPESLVFVRDFYQPFMNITMNMLSGIKDFTEQHSYNYFILMGLYFALFLPSQLISMFIRRQKKKVGFSGRYKKD